MHQLWAIIFSSQKQYSLVFALHWSFFFCYKFHDFHMSNKVFTRICSKIFRQHATTKTLLRAFQDRRLRWKTKFFIKLVDICKEGTKEQLVHLKKKKRFSQSLPRRVESICFFFNFSFKFRFISFNTHSPHLPTIVYQDFFICRRWSLWKRCGKLKFMKQWRCHEVYTEEENWRKKKKRANSSSKDVLIILSREVFFNSRFSFDQFLKDRFFLKRFFIF